jgi:hypothetical protein
MSIYKVYLKELLERVIEVEASNKEQALSIVEAMYKNEEIVFGVNDFIDYYIDCDKSDYRDKEDI